MYTVREISCVLRGHGRAAARNEGSPTRRSGTGWRSTLTTLVKRACRCSVLEVLPTQPESGTDMRGGRSSRMSALLMAGVLVVGCGAPAPSDQPAVDALVRSYDERSGVWPTTGWWNSANALIALTDYMIVSGDHRYVWVVENTFTKKRNAARGDFTNDFIDDTGWWALAWISAYDLTGDTRYLQTAQRDVDFMWSYHDDVCGGGLWWTVRREYKHAITNELFVQAAAELGPASGRRGLGLPRTGGLGVELVRGVRDDQRRTVGQRRPRARDLPQQRRTPSGPTTRACSSAASSPWPAGPATTAYLQRARELADASTTSQTLHVDGVLTEPCEQSGCDADAPSYKGIYVRNLGELNRALDDHPYSEYLVHQASTAYAPEPHRTTSTGCTGPDRSSTSAAPPNKARSTSWLRPQSIADTPGNIAPSPWD